MNVTDENLTTEQAAIDAAITLGKCFADPAVVTVKVELYGQDLVEVGRLAAILNVGFNEAFNHIVQHVAPHMSFWHLALSAIEDAETKERERKVQNEE